LLTGAAGLVVGLVGEPLAVAAASALVVYLLVACSFHVVNGDVSHIPTPALQLT
jgi:hypothetical protein